MPSPTTTAAAPKRGWRLTKRAAIVVGAVLSFSTAAAADVLVQNYMSTTFEASTPPCLIKVAGEDVASFPDGFGFDATQTATVDGLAITEEAVTINGVTGDRVLADEVYVIRNDCTVPLNVSIVAAEAAGDWDEKHLEVWLGNTTATGAYPTVTPDAGSTEWDQAPIVITATGVTNATTGVVSVPPNGGSVSVGMVVTTGQSAPTTGSGTATWRVQAESQ